jgi:hypothetical protein
LTKVEDSDKLIHGGGNMLEYMLAKLKHEELIKEAEKERMLRDARQLKVLYGSNVQREQAEKERRVAVKS